MMDFDTQFSPRLIIVVIKHKPYVTYSIFHFYKDKNVLAEKINDPHHMNENLMKNILFQILTDTDYKI